MKLYYNNIYNLILIIICQIRKLWLSVRRQSFHEISGETNYFYLIERKAHLLPVNKNLFKSFKTILSKELFLQIQFALLTNYFLFLNPIMHHFLSSIF